MLNNEDFKPFGYIGLVELYSIFNEQEKIKEIILDIDNDSKLSEKIIFSAIRYSPEAAIKLLDVWKEVNPGERGRIEQLILQLKTTNE